MIMRRVKILLCLLAVPFSLSSCSGCMSQFDSATWAPRDGHILNGRAAVVYSSRYEIDLAGLENKHTFDIHKYRHMAQMLVRQGYLTTADFYVPSQADRELLLTVHTPEYLEKLKSSSNVARYLEVGALALLPSGVTDGRVLAAFRATTGGTLLAARLAMDCGLGINLGGGYHHAHADHGEGFCIYADVPIAIRTLQKEGRISRAMIVDLDVHQGNGNASIFLGDESVFIMDIFEKKNYPRLKVPVSLSLGLDPPVSDTRYIKILHDNLPGALDNFRPDLLVMMAGVDPHFRDNLGHFSLSDQGIVRRDEYVAAEARSRHIPVLYVTGGGYSAEAARVQAASIANLLTKFAGVKPRPAP
jgi:histone deacetylase 11